MKEWFSKWPKIEVMSLGDEINEIQEYQVPPTVPVVVIAAKEDFFSTEMCHCFLPPKPDAKHPVLLSVIAPNADKFLASAEKMNQVM